jgi:protein involved in polysaccharide export with SLBB domain
MNVGLESVLIFLFGHFRATVKFIILAFAAILISSSAFETPPQNVEAKNVPAEADLIHYGDLIDVDIVGNLEYDWRGTVNPEGFLDGLVLANDAVYALCRSESSVAAEITTQYSRVLKDPKIIVKVLDRSGRASSILLGAVRNQQRFKLVRETRLNELLALSGGITDMASGEVTVFRPSNLNCYDSLPGVERPRSTIMRISLSKLLEGDPDANPTINSGDIVTVVEAAPIFLVGGVNTPKRISSREELSVSRAIAAAGGISKDGLEEEITIYRREGKNTRVLNADLKKIRSKRQDDLLLKPFDIVEAGEKGRTKSRFPAVPDVAPQNRDIFKTPIRIVE